MTLALADVQKLLPETAHMMYALRFRNFMNFSRHQKQHLHTHMAALTSLLSWWYLASFSSTFSSITLTMRRIAIIREPNATVPENTRFVSAKLPLLHNVFALALAA